MQTSTKCKVFITFCLVFITQFAIFAQQKQDVIYRNYIDYESNSFSEDFAVIGNNAITYKGFENKAYNQSKSRKEITNDMAFIDAGKSQYQFFFDQIYPHIKKGGILVSDNVLFRGEVCQKSELDVTKRNRTIYRRMNNYLSFLMTENNRCHTSLIPIGDGMAVTIKMEDEMTLR